MGKINWKDYEEEFEELAQYVYNHKKISEKLILKDLSSVCKNHPDWFKKVNGVNFSLIAFLEFLFYKAKGPYSSDFVKYAEIITLIISKSPSLIEMLNKSAVSAIANMLLSKGGLKFSIADKYELDELLQYWKMFGLNEVKSRTIFDKIIVTPSVLKKIHNKDPDIFTRILEVFPEYYQEIASYDISIKKYCGLSSKTAIERYESLYLEYNNKGININTMIKKEEQRHSFSSKKRNLFLAYLVKRKHYFTCQICRFCGKGPNESFVDIHHIIPLSLKGSDVAHNMLVTCRFHHDMIHKNEILVRLSNQIEISYNDQKYFLHPNS